MPGHAQRCAVHAADIGHAHGLLPYRPARESALQRRSWAAISFRVSAKVATNMRYLAPALYLVRARHAVKE